MVLGQNLEQARPLLGEQREVLHEIEEAHRVADASEHHLERDTAGFVLPLDALPLEEPLPVRRERADAALDAVGGDEQGVVPEQVGDAVLRVLVAREVVVERLLGRNPRLLQLHHHQRQTVHESDEIGAAGVERPGDRHLADQQEVVARERIQPVDDPQPLHLLSAVLAVRHGNRDAVLEQVVHLAVGRDEAHGGAVPRQRFNRDGERLWRDRRVQAFKRGPQPGHQHDLGGRLAPERAGWPHHFVQRGHRLPAHRREELNGRLFDELIFGVGVRHGVRRRCR